MFYYKDIDTSAYLYNAILRFISSSLQLFGYVLAKAQRSCILLFFVKQSFTLVILLLRRREGMLRSCSCCYFFSVQLSFFLSSQAVLPSFIHSGVLYSAVHTCSFFPHFFLGLGFFPPSSFMADRELPQVSSVLWFY